MTDNIVVFPSFADPQQVRPYEMRQLVSALEARFRGLEQNQTISVGGVELDLDDLDDRYAASSHTHTIADISDFGSYLENIESESIFDLSDVAGSPSNNDTLVWNATTSRFEPVAVTLDGSALNDLTNVSVASPADGDVLTWVNSASEWQAVAPTSGGSSDYLTTTDEIVPVHQLGLTYSLFWGQALARMEMFNDAAATTGGFWFNFQSGHNEPSIRIGQASDTDFQLDTDNGLRIYNGLDVRWHDASDSDTATFYHDGTDFNSDFVGTTDWNITGLTAIAAGAVSADFDAITATSYGGITEANLLDKSATETVSGDWTFNGATVVPEATVTAHEAALTIAETQITDGSLLARLAAAEVITGQWTFEDRVDIDDGAALRIHDATDTDYMELSHDGTDLNAAFVNTTDLNLLDGIVLKVFDSTDTDFISLSHTGSNAIIDAEGAGSLFFTGVSQVIVSDGAALRVRDAGGTDWLDFSHDGTDFNVAGTNTTDLNITGISGFNVVNYAFDVDQTVGAGQDDYILTYDNATGLISLEVAPSGSLPADPNLNALLYWDDTGGSADWVDTLQVQSGALRILDAGLTDYGDFSHDGTNFNTNFTNTATWAVDGLTGSFQIRSSGAAKFDVDNVNSQVRVRDGYSLRVFDSTDTDYVDFSHDGADFNIAGVNTTSINFTGAAIVFDQAPTVESTSIFQHWIETDASLNETWWRWAGSSGDLVLDTMTDAGAFTNRALSFQRSGTTVDEIEMNATLMDLNGNVDISGTLNIVGIMTTGAGQIEVGSANPAAFPSSSSLPRIYRATTGHPTAGGLSEIGSLYLAGRNDATGRGVLIGAGGSGSDEAIVAAFGTTEIELNATTLDFNGEPFFNDGLQIDDGTSTLTFDPSGNGNIKASTGSFDIDCAGGIVRLGRTTSVTTNSLFVMRGNNSTTAGMILDVESSSGKAGLFIEEGASAQADRAGKGQFWVLNTTPNRPYFTADTGEDLPMVGGLLQRSIGSGNYTLQMEDIGRYLTKTSGGGGETVTIPANASVSFPNGTIIPVENRGGGVLSIAITSDTLIWPAGSGTGTRSLADDSFCCLMKVGNVVWMIAGAGVS